MVLNSGLLDAYARTSYRAQTPDGEVILRLGEPCPLLDVLLQKENVVTWAFVTAANPGSQPLPAAENERRCDTLEREVREMGRRAFAGAGVPDEAGWLPERSLLILGIDRAAAVRLGQHWGQLAVVVGTHGAAAELVLC